MTKDEERNLQLLQTRVRQLILSHNALKADKQRLEEVVRARDAEISSLKADMESLRVDMGRLKTAKTIELGSGDTSIARQRLSKLIREVDKCIALLNV